MDRHSRLSQEDKDKWVCRRAARDSLFFHCAVEKHSFNFLSAGRYAIISCVNLLTQGPLHGMFLLLISKPAFYRWLNFAISWRLYNRRNGLPEHSLSTSRCFADRERRDDEGLYAPAVPDLHIDLL